MQLLAAGLLVAATLTTCAPINAQDGASPGYSRAQFGGWIDADGDGCNTREVILERDAQQPTDSDGDGCRDDAPITDRYTGRPVAARDADIDHVVSLRDAWDSGASSWTETRRTDFGNDPVNLWATAARINRAKGDDEPQQWRPDDPGVWCAYATTYRNAKVTYRLSISPAQDRALVGMCPEGDKR